MEKNNETLSILRHSTSHIMAQAVQSLFPNAKLAIGPSTADGFYYDFDLTDGHAFTQEDLDKIEEKMKEIVKQNLTFEKYQVEDVEAKIAEFKADYERYNSKMQEFRSQFNSWKTSEQERISQLKIILPTNLLGIFEEIRKQGDPSSK